jgi:hypothetical protein
MPSNVKQFKQVQTISNNFKQVQAIPSNFNKFQSFQTFQTFLSNFIHIKQVQAMSMQKQQMW